MANLLDSLGTNAIPFAGKSTCAHFSRAGRRCLLPPLEGDVLCVRHGGGDSPTLNEDAKRRLLALRIDAIETLEELMTISVDDKVRAACALAVLDRTGHGPKSTIALERPKEDLSGKTWDELADEFAALERTAREESAARAERTHGTRREEPEDAPPVKPVADPAKIH